MPGIFGVVVQMKPRYYGEARNVLMSVLSSEYQHPKIAIAVDVDVDIFNYAEVLWAINTRVNPAEDIVVIPGAKIHAMDPSCPEFGHPGAPGWHRIGGKMMIDATKPPECDGKRRDEFERLRPVGWETIDLADYLAGGFAAAAELNRRYRWDKRWFRVHGLKSSKDESIQTMERRTSRWCYVIPQVRRNNLARFFL